MAPFWKSAALLFVALRFGDLVNFVTGVWLVPKFVGPSELGAVMPLVQAAGLLSLPVSILVAPYSRLLAVHLARGQAGKAKAMVRDAALVSGAAFLASAAVSPFVLPPLFSRFRVENGNLAVAIIASAAVGAVTPVFSETVRAMGRFGVVSLCNLVCAPLRFAVMAVAMPLRGITGYFVGQSAGPVFTSILSLGAFLRGVGRVRPEPYWREDRAAFFSFVVPFAALSVAGGVRAMAELMPMSFIPQTEAAAYYQISRFSELATYAGVTLVYMLFPVVAARQAQGKDSIDLLLRTMAFSALGGLALSAAVAAAARFLFPFFPFLSPYAEYSGYILPFGAISSLRVSAACFEAHETGRSDFRFVRWALPVHLAATAALALICRGPEALRLGAWHLRHVVFAMGLPSAAIFAGAFATALLRFRSVGR